MADQIFGFRRWSLTDEKTNEQRSGANLFALMPIDSPGKGFETVSIPADEAAASKLDKVKEFPVLAELHQRVVKKPGKFGSIAAIVVSDLTLAG